MDDWIDELLERNRGAGLVAGVPRWAHARPDNDPPAAVLDDDWAPPSATDDGVEM